MPRIAIGVGLVTCLILFLALTIAGDDDRKRAPNVSPPPTSTNEPIKDQNQKSGR